MAGVRSKNSSFFLPEEMVFKILTLLPVISLLRCKSVCKTWLSIISNPQFIQAHLIESRKKPSYVLNVVKNSIYIDTRETSTLLNMLTFFKRSIEIVCSCNGLVCISDRATDVIYLGNPMTRQFKKLPPPSDQFDDCVDSLLGFGFDDISNDYKILRISLVPEEEDDIDDDAVACALQAEMYSANDDLWKEIQIPETLEYFQIIGIVCVNIKGSRVLYFEGRYGLLSFDLHDEVFRVYPYPKSYPTSVLRYIQRRSIVLDFEGSVALIFNETNDFSVISLWTLNDILGNWSQTKVFNLDDSLKYIRVTSLYLGDGQFFVSGVGEYIFHDYKKKHVKIFLNESPAYARNITDYTETLVSLKGFQQLE